MSTQNLWQDLNLNRSSLKRARINPVASASGLTSPLDGEVYFDTFAGAKRLNFYDETSAAWIKVPRLDYAETVTGAWTFNTGGAPFAVGSATLVTNLNANFLSGYAGSQTETAGSVAVRYTNGRLKVGDATDDLDAVNLRTMVAAVQNRSGKDAVRVATTTTLPTNTISGIVITATANGAFPSIDGVSLSLNDSILVLHEGDVDSGDNGYIGTSNRKNGIYTLTQVGDGSNPWTLTRRSDADISAEMTSGSTVFVNEGTANIHSEWTLQTDVTLTTNGSDGTTVTFFKSGGNSLYAAGNGLVLSGNTFHFAQSSNYTVGSLFYASSTSGNSAVSQITPGGANKVLGLNAANNAPEYKTVQGVADEINVDLSTPGQITIGIVDPLKLTKGGTGADLSAAGATGGLVYKSASTTLGITSALSGLLYGAGSGAPAAVTGLTSGTLPKYSSSPYLVNSLFSDDGTTALVGGHLRVGDTTAAASTRFHAGISSVRYFNFLTGTGYTYRYDDSITATLFFENRDIALPSGNGVQFTVNLATDAATTAIAAGKILIAKEQTWTSTTTTQDAYFNLQLARNGGMFDAVRINSNGNVGINLTAPAAGLHGTDSSGTVLWADSNTNSAQKSVRYGTTHYTSATEEPFYGITLVSGSNFNTMIVGGGTGLGNAATSIAFNTAANNTTVTGTLRWTIKSDGVLESNGAGAIGTTSAGNLTLTTAASGNIVMTPGGAGWVDIYRAASPALYITHTDATSFGQIRFYEAANRNGALQLIGSNFATADRRDAFELVNYTVLGNLSFWTNSLRRWQILANGQLESEAATTIKTKTGTLTIQSGGGNGNVVLTPDGTGNIVLSNLTNGVLSVASGVVSAGPVASGSLPGSFSGFDNPSATIGLTATNGAATTAMRSDAAPALSQSITPTWTGAHVWNTGTTPADVAQLLITQPGSAGTRSSHYLLLRGTSYDTTGHNSDWRMYVAPTTNAGVSSLLFASRIDANGYTARLTIGDNSSLTAGSVLPKTTNTYALGSASAQFNSAYIKALNMTATAADTSTNALAINFLTDGTNPSWVLVQRGRSHSTEPGRLFFYHYDGASFLIPLSMHASGKVNVGENGDVGIGALGTAATAKLHILPPGRAGASGIGVGGFHLAGATYTDSATANLGTSASWAYATINAPTLASTNSVTTTDAATFYIQAAPTTGSNQTITRKWSLWADSGDVRIDGGLVVGATMLASDRNFHLGGAITAPAGFAYNAVFVGSLTAAANNDDLIGLYIYPTFTVGGYTGVDKWAVYSYSTEKSFWNGTFRMNSLTASRLVYTDSNKDLASVTAGTDNVFAKWSSGVITNSILSEVGGTQVKVSAGSLYVELNAIGESFRADGWTSGGSDFRIQHDSFAFVRIYNNRGGSTGGIRMMDHIGNTTRFEFGANGVAKFSALTTNGLLQTSGSDGTIGVSNLLPIGTTLNGSPILRKFTSTIGNGSSTSFTITHNLGTKDVMVFLRKASNDEISSISAVATTTNTATITFTFAPTSSEFEAIVLG